MRRPLRPGPQHRRGPVFGGRRGEDGAECNKTPVNEVSTCKPSPHGTETLTSQKGLHESHRAQTGCHLQQRQEGGLRAENLRRLLPRRKPTSFANGATKRAPPTLV